MSGISRRAQGGAAVVAAAVIAVALVTGTPGAARAEASAADIQWAQTILKDKGYNIGGRAKGQMTPETHAALSAFQKSAGLPVTGNLDQATIARMMGDREKKAAPTMGSLSKSQIGQTRHEKEVVPRAAPTARVDAGNESIGGMAQFGSAPTPTSSSSSAAAANHPGPMPSGATAADGPVPQAAAPRGAVSATNAAGQAVAVTEPTAVGGPSGLSSVWMTNGLRAGVAGLVALTLGGIGVAWWRSGRRVGPIGGTPAGNDSPRDGRIEPSFGTARRREELTPGPRLTADLRRR